VSRAAVVALDGVEQGVVQDAVIRGAIRRLGVRRLPEIDAADCEASARVAEAFVRSRASSYCEREFVVVVTRQPVVRAACSAKPPQPGPIRPRPDQRLCEEPQP
jgi:hypothetical protein